MARRLAGAVAVLAATGVLVGAAVAFAAGGTTSSPSVPRSAPADYQTMPAASHHGNCPNMGGGSSGSGGSSGTSDPSGSPATSL
jgi:hypothetical protein